MKEQIEELIKKYRAIYRDLNSVKSGGVSTPSLNTRIEMIRDVISDLQNLLKQAQ